MNRKLIAALALGALALGAAAPADASARGAAPQITKVSPREAAIGRTLYVRGRNFVPRRTKVAFGRADGRTVFERAHRVTRTKLAVRVPTRLEPLLVRGEDGSPQPTVFRLRVVTTRASRPTRPALSPTIARSAGGDSGPQSPTADCDRDGQVDPSDADDDDDLLSDGTEQALGMGVCNVDTDGDGMQDGWEYWSARDLNTRAVPYPGKRPWPNPLDGADGGYDFDGDTLTSSEEHAAWRVESGRGHKRFEASLVDTPGVSPLAYSDGVQTSTPARPAIEPAWITSVLQSGRFAQSQSYADWLDVHDLGVWSDEERDADLDGLSNFIETHGPGSYAWWVAYFKKYDVQPWPQTYWGEFTRRPFADVQVADPDSDGDSLLDAEDDQDADDVPNLVEMNAPLVFEERNVNPFNPCAPFEDSRTCPRYEPLD